MEKKRTNSNKCMVPSCNMKFRTVQDSINLLENEHNAEIQRTMLSFNSFDEFLSWKEKEQNENNVFFHENKKIFSK